MNPDAIAIIGIAGRFPDARNLDEFWRNVRDGVESLHTFTDADLDASRVPHDIRAKANYVRKGTTIEDPDCFDAAFFGYSPGEAQILDPQQRVFLECAWQAIENAGYAGRVAGQAVGVYAGASSSSYAVNEIAAAPAVAAAVGQYQIMIGNDKDYLCTRVSYELDLRGPSVTVQTACSTSLVAVQMACRALRRGECDLALAGGVSIRFPERAGYEFVEGMIHSPDGHCRPFDAKARGTRAGAGAGVVVLKRLADAIADRDTIRAVILGAATNNDGAGKAGFTAPSIDGQIEVIAMAHALAGVDARSITYLEAHGTGTPLGDPVEIAAAAQVFRDTTSDVGFCRLGSLKANLGHLDAAAGIAGLIKTVLALEHRELPPLVNFESPNPQLNLDLSPFYASARSAPWRADGGPRRAGVSAFGIGGTNAHVVLEEAPAREPGASTRTHQLIVLSARTPAALEAATANLARKLEEAPDISLADVAYTLQVGRASFSERRALVAGTTADVVRALATPEKNPVVTGSHGDAPRAVAFLFTGQGSQHSRMGAGLYTAEHVYREAFDRCAAVLTPRIGHDLRRALVAGEAPAELVESTAFAQPALFAVEYALAQLWMSWGVTPAAMLGHSIGEYVAAHLAGVFTLEDALHIVAERGRLMQSLPAGAMLALHLREADVTPYLRNGIELAAVNASELCTVAGPRPAIDALITELNAASVNHRVLHTSHAFHSSMMDPILSEFTAIVGAVTRRSPQIPYISNVTGTWITESQAASPAYYASHLRQTVRFLDGVRTLTSERADALLEVGPGVTLATLARESVDAPARRRVVASLGHQREARDDVDAVLDAAGRLWISGVTIDWTAMHANERLYRIPLPAYPFERVRHRVSVTAPKAPPPQESQRPRPEPVPVEVAITRVWEELLGVSPIRPDDNFFELGGHSLLATRVMSRLAEEYGIDLPVYSIFNAPTIASLAQKHRELAGDGAASAREELEL